MTQIYFSFDTEDFTDHSSSDALLKEAELLRRNGVAGNFNLVGDLAKELIRARRYDVLDALRYHDISFHSAHHSIHPTLSEYTDMEDYAKARDLFIKDEYTGMGMVKAATGIDRFQCAVMPGNNFSYVALYNYAEAGIPLYLGTWITPPKGEGILLCNQLHIDYEYRFVLEEHFFKSDYELAPILDMLAQNRRAVIYTHPNMANHREFWDGVNYDGINKHPYGQWEPAPLRSEEEVNLFFSRFQELITALQADPRFSIGRVSDLRTYSEKQLFERQVTRDMLPAIKASLEKDFVCVDSPERLCVADCFMAARHFLFSDKPFTPGPVHGFLEEPCGISSPVTLCADQVRRLAASVSVSGFLPASFTADGMRIGPADLLFAMLDVAMGADSVVLNPREQQCKAPSDIGHYWQERLDGTWLFSKDFKDSFLTRRLHLQAWTIFHESR